MQISSLVAASAIAGLLHWTEAAPDCVGSKPRLAGSQGQRSTLGRAEYHSRRLPSNAIGNSAHRSSALSIHGSVAPVSLSSKSSILSHRISSSIDLSRRAHSSRSLLGSLSTLSEKALRNINVLPSDPIKSEVDYYYGLTSSQKMESRRTKERRARRETVIQKIQQNSQEQKDERNDYLSRKGVITLPKHHRQVDSSLSDEW